jgi:hypothetical protein
VGLAKFTIMQRQRKRNYTKTMKGDLHRSRGDICESTL